MSSQKCFKANPLQNRQHGTGGGKLSKYWVKSFDAVSLKLWDSVRRTGGRVRASAGEKSSGECWERTKTR